jgi:hypothetical protein
MISATHPARPMVVAASGVTFGTMTHHRKKSNPGRQELPEEEHRTSNVIKEKFRRLSWCCL